MASASVSTRYRSASAGFLQRGLPDGHLLLLAQDCLVLVGLSQRPSAAALACAASSALAEALRAEGDAEAAAILARGEAEAEAMNTKAEAYARYNEAAVLEMLVAVLPQVAEKAAAPMAGIDKLTVVSTDGAGALPKQVTGNIVETMELLKNTTGVDLSQLPATYTGQG